MPHNVEDEFLEAFQRIVAQSPRNEKLRARILAGEILKANQSTVSLEAGHSRTLLSQRAKGYERICALLYPEAQKTVDRRSGDSVEKVADRVSRLTEEVRQLERERDQYATCLAEAYLAIELKDRLISQIRAEVARKERNVASSLDRGSGHSDPV